MRLACAALACCLVPAAPAGAQSFGLGAHIAMVRADQTADEDRVRFNGGHIRARMSPRTAFEVALDLRTTTSETRMQRVREYPIQASLLLSPVRAALSPYVLGGGGWYTERLERQSGTSWTLEDSTRRFGWHGGFGAELRLGRRAAAHADYRYTFLRFRDEDDDDEGRLGRLLPSYEGSMWTAGLTFYF